MAIINIEGLNKEEVAFALYKNANNKSKEAINKREEYLKLKAKYVAGLYTEMSLSDVSKELDFAKKYAGGKIDYLGCVLFYITFCSNTVNTDYYDRVHTPGVNGVKSSEKVIAELRFAQLSISIPSLDFSKKRAHCNTVTLEEIIPASDASKKLCL